jgi:hypothetical protein
MVRHKHLVFFSGGIGSWLSAKRIAKQEDVHHLTLLFADTKIEDEDLYRFLPEAVDNLRQDAEVEFVTIADGRDPWEVFEAVKFIGNSRVDPCSRVLKRDLMQKWRDEHCDPKHTTLYYGIDWTEIHRLDRIRKRTPGWDIEAPLTEPPYLNKKEMIELLKAENIKPPRLYDLGFAHNNCGGFCVKSGQAQFARLLHTMPERYAYHEKKESTLAAKIGKNVSILRDRKGGAASPLSLKAFRERVEMQPNLFDKNDWGGCGCAME